MKFNNDNGSYGPPTPSAAYSVHSGLHKECTTLHKEMLSISTEGMLKIMKWRFDKKRVYTERTGKPVVTVPYSEILWLITKSNKSGVWLTEKEFKTLAEIIEAQKDSVEICRSDEEYE